MDKISSLSNPVVKHLVSLRKDKDYRCQENTVLIEGKKLVEEVCRDTRAVKILTDDSKLVSKNLKYEASFLVTPEIIKKISGVQHPEGIIAEVPLPAASTLVGLHYVVAFDGVADPGNLGTLFRTALALGWEGAYLLDGCCDPFNDKAIRAAKGATFRFPIGKGSWNDLEKLIKKNHLKAIAADLDGKNLKEFSTKKGVLLVLGSESHGLSAQAEKLCEKVSIPMSGRMESLNVSIAGGIIMYSIRNQ